MVVEIGACGESFSTYITLCEKDKLINQCKDCSMTFAALTVRFLARMDATMSIQ